MGSVYIERIADAKQNIHMYTYTNQHMHVVHKRVCLLHVYGEPKRV